MSLKIALVQDSPVWMNRQASLQKILTHIDEAAARGAQLVALGESWLSGYPAWLDYALDYARWDDSGTKAVFADFRASAIVIPGPETAAIAAACARHALYLVMGANERVDRGPGNGTVYNTLLIFDPAGQLIKHHRKLMPTYTEKLLYGMGDGKSLGSVKAPWGGLGGLICWEHWMPLTRQAMHDDGEHIHVALWPTVHDMHQVASRHYAFEGKTFVIAVGQLLQVKELGTDMQARLDSKLRKQPNTFLLKGGSAVIHPNGQYVLDPVFEERGVFMVEIDPDECMGERMTLDVSGHYQRADVFDFRRKV